MEDTETTDNRLLDMVTLKDYDVSRLYQGRHAAAASIANRT